MPTFDAVSSTDDANTTNPVTWTHTSAAGADLAVMGVCHNSAQSYSASSLAGSAMTTVFADSVKVSTEVTMTYLLAPTSGAQTASVTHNSNTDQADGMVSWLGVLRQAPTASATTDGSSTDISITVTTIPGDLVIAVFGQVGVSGVSWTPGADVNERLERAIAAGEHRGEVVICDKIATGTSTTISYTVSAGVNWVGIAGVWSTGGGQIIVWTSE